jgi:glyoxylase-like metal-dependent hydrolase (beta-lactamase superfamily II)
MIHIGAIEIEVISDGVVHVDAGGPFGLTPRALYQTTFAPDADNLIPMALNCLLVRAAGKTIVIDTGLGDRLTDKQRAIWRLTRPKGGLLAGLARIGVQPSDIDIVINTHLHADHTSGNMSDAVAGDGTPVLRPVFPRAIYYTQRREYEDAMRPNERTRATYIPPNYAPLVESGQMRLLDGDAEIVPGIFGIVARGHTPAMMVIRLEDGGQHALFVTDLAMYAVLFEKLGWMSAYDVEPLYTLESKRVWQAWAQHHDALLIFQHDPFLVTGRLNQAGKVVPVSP